MTHPPTAASSHPTRDQPPARPRTVAVIPARLASSRLPRKMLRELAGKPLLGWAYEAAAKSEVFDQVVVALDSPELAELCTVHGWPWRMTSPECPSGTDRLYAIARELGADIYVNVQGDEPLLRAAHFAALLAPFARGEVDCSTLRVPCRPDEVDNPNVVKVVCGLDGRALYFSRAAIPFNRDAQPNVPYWKHLGLYAYRRAALERFATLAPSPLELTERLEQLRLLENGIALHVADAPEDTVGVDTEEDLLRAETILRQRADLAALKAEGT